MNRNHSVSGVNMGHLWDRVDLLREELDALIQLWRTGAVKPRVHAAVPFTEAARAHQLLTQRRNVGKVVLIP